MFLDMIKQVMVCCYGDVSAHKQAALPTVIVHISHEAEAVAVAALQCLAMLSYGESDSAENICEQLLDISTRSGSHSLRLSFIFRV